MVAATAALVIGVQYLKGSDILNRSKTFHGIYEHVSGLSVGSSVTINGFQVGIVKEVQLHPIHPGMVIVSFSITNSEFEFSRDSKAHIEMVDLMGEKTISIKFGSSTALAQNGDTLATSIEAGLMDEVNAQIAPLKLKTENMVASIDSVMTIMESLLKNDAQPNLEESFVSLRRTLASLENTSNRLDGLMASESQRLTAIFKNVESITENLNNNNDQLTNILTNFSQLSDTLIKADVSRVVNKAAVALESTADIMKKIESGEGSMGLLLNNDSLYRNLESASLNLDALLEDIRVHPRRYVSFSLIERKEKELKLTNKEVQQLQEILNQ